MGNVWYLSLNIMRRECASPILGPRLMARDTVPTQTGGIFPLFKDNEMTMYSTIIRLRRGFGGDILQHLSSPFDQTSEATVILCISAGLVKVQPTILSLELKHCSSSRKWFLKRTGLLAGQEHTLIWLLSCCPRDMFDLHSLNSVAWESKNTLAV